MVLSGDAASAAQVNAALVGAGVGVTRLEPVRHSLEQRFLRSPPGSTRDLLPEEVKA